MTSTSTAADVRFSRALDEPAAAEPSTSGSKAASLASARAAGIRTVPGFVVTTDAHRAYLDAGRRLPEEVATRLRGHWATASRDGELPLVVRSSSTVEDIGASSMAGRFRSVLDVRGWTAFLAAVDTVLRSADEVAGGSAPSPMGVLVQPYVVPRCGGVMFGLDPVSGDEGHVVVEAVAGGPDALVSGAVSAQHYVANLRGRLLSVDHHPHHRLARHHGRLLSDHEVRALVALAARAARTFGSPQDVEWAVDAHGVLLLQSRPVTAAGATAHPTGPVLGPGPVAESFPDPLGPLEQDLWVAPLRNGVVAALRETRAVSARRLESSPVVVTVNGRVAADLELFGYVPSRQRLSLLDPRPPLRRLAAAWHVGRLRADLPERAAAHVRRVDAELMAPDLAGMTDLQLLTLLQRCTVVLRDLHHEEVLAGTLLPPSDVTAAAVALPILAAARDRDRTDALVQRHPVLLSLFPPALGVPTQLPAASPRATQNWSTPSRRPSFRDLAAREQIRLRARWVQELTARAAWQLGLRLAARGLLADPRAVALLDLVALGDAVATGTLPDDLESRRHRAARDAFGPPLPAQFRLTADGHVAPAGRVGARPGSGVGAGGGRGTGPAVHPSARRPPGPGDVLVVRTLQPELAGWLPGLAGLVSETGGTLSHLAILAREYGVPTVVGLHDALRRFPPGTQLVVDGATGEVSEVLGEADS